MAASHCVKADAILCTSTVRQAKHLRCHVTTRSTKSSRSRFAKTLRFRLQSDAESGSEWFLATNAHATRRAGPQVYLPLMPNRRKSRRDKLGGHPLDGLAVGCEQATPVMGTRAGFDADGARRQSGHPLIELGARDLGWRSCTAPAALIPCNVNTFLARSIPTKTMDITSPSE